MTKNMLKKIGILIGSVGLMISPLATMAAVGDLLCTESSGVVSCTGIGWSPSTTVAMMMGTTDICGAPGPSDWVIVSDISGNLNDSSPGVIPDDTYYVYGTEDACATSVASSTNPLVIGLAPVSGGMDSTALAAGITTAFGTFASQYGSIIILIVGFAIGLYGVKLAYGWLTNLVRARGESSDRRTKRRR